MRRGGYRTVPIREVVTFGDGATLDVPGTPHVVLLTPGHAPGSAALHLPDRRVLFVGDALATYNVVDGSVGPQIAPFGSDWDSALQSLSRIELSMRPSSCPVTVPHGRMGPRLRSGRFDGAAGAR